MNKLVKSLEDAIKACGIKDGMTLSFHHHLRDGDYVTPMVLKTIEKLGIKNIKITTSGFMDGMASHEGMLDLVYNGTITDMDLTGAGSIYGELLSRGVFPNVAKYRTHGGRSAAIETGVLKIDVVFVAASESDFCGNCNGINGKNAFGAMGYPMVDVLYADKVVVVTDNLVNYPVIRASIDERYVDYVVKVESIGDPNGIVSGILRPSKDPVALKLGESAAEVIKNSGLLKDGFSFQAGGSGISIATSKLIHQTMKENNVHGSFILGGITGYSVDMLEDGLFDCILDTQSFDRRAIEHLQNRPIKHREISCSTYASPNAKSCAVNNVDAVLLGALQVDLDFNVNVNLMSSGFFTGGGGGHGDASEGSKMSIIVTPLTRTRIPTIVDKVICKSVQGENIDVIVTEYGVAVNPKNVELKQRLKEGKVKLVEIDELEAMARKLVGIPDPVRFGDKPVCEIYHRNGTVLDTIYNVL